MDNLTKYIFDNYSSLLTFSEKMTWRFLLFKAKGRLEEAESILSGNVGPSIRKLIEGGEAEFYIKARDRILRENQNEVYLNTCPMCGHLTRTPRAKQCTKCKHDWH